MRVRAISDSGDWTFGKGRNDYKVNNACVMQNIKTRLRSFVGDCFFATNEGVDWFGLLGAKDLIAVELAARTTILGTEGVTKILKFETILDSSTRALTMTYEVETIYNRQDLLTPFERQGSLLITQDGDLITTEDGDSLGIG